MSRTKWRYATVIMWPKGRIHPVALPNEFGWSPERNARFVEAINDGLDSVLNLMGTFGWEAVATMPHPEGHAVILKRATDERAEEYHAEEE